MIYVQPLGQFDTVRRKVLDRTAEFLGIYFQLPVKVRKDLSPGRGAGGGPARAPDLAGQADPLDLRAGESVAAAAARRRLRVHRADDLRLVARRGVEFRLRPGVVERARGRVVDRSQRRSPRRGAAAFRLCLLRTLKTASHETGHMFSIQHCTLYECNMCGSNHQKEADGHPLWLCPYCLAKLCYATGADPAKRYKEFAAFSKREGLKAEQKFYEKSLALLEAAK